MNKKITYAIFQNRNTARKLVYYPVAKNANSSAKLFFLKHLKMDKNYYFLSDKVPEYKVNEDSKYKNLDKKYNLVNFLPSYTPFEKIEVDEKCCIIRNPIKRFISAYKNRVLFHKDFGFRNLNINEIIEKLENNSFDNRHFLPQSYWLGSDLRYFTIVSNISNMETFINGVNNFFQNKVEFPRIQTGGDDENITLTDSQIIKLKKIYSSDYDLIGDLL
mgnify:FL=1|tara:strand:+ start:167 stop:820 length:654 start_codon:yes stop_codon:yes gene_type:complete